MDTQKHRGLVLTRRRREALLLSPGTPNEVLIRVLDVGPGVVRLGIGCAKEMLVLREELLERKEDCRGD